MGIDGPELESICITQGTGMERGGLVRMDMNEEMRTDGEGLQLWVRAYRTDQAG